MLSTTSLVNQLIRDFPAISFVPGNRFYWSPDECTIYYEDTGDAVSLLHEVAHAALGHKKYTYDVELLRMEREAWDFTSSSLAKNYRVKIDSGIVENMLDTYRDWLHSRSLCPECEATGIQTGMKYYSCPACNHTWRVNEARSCALRRYAVPSSRK